MNEIIYYDLNRFAPFDNKTEQNYPLEKQSQESPEDYFWNHVFVDYPPLCNVKIKEFENAVRNSSINSVLFYGYSGTGKTTFLHYIDRKYKIRYSDLFDSDFVNLIRNPGSTDSISIIVSALDDKIKENLTTEVAENFILFYDRYVESVPSEKANWPSKFLKDIGYDYTYSFLNFLGKCSYKYSKQNIQYLCDSIKTLSEKIALYVICYIINRCLKNNKIGIVVFDNLDELDQIHLSQLLDDDLYTAYSKAQSFFECFIPEYGFKAMCTFVKSIRITNNAFRNKSQLDDRSKSTSKEIIFDCLADSYEIIKKRNSQNDGDILQLIKMEKVFIRNSLSKLYNYDIRALLFSFGEDFYKTKSMILRKILVDEDCKVIGRGCILFKILQARNNVTDAPFLIDATEAIRLKYCDVLRMALTTLANMANVKTNHPSYGNGKSSNLQSVSLLDFTNRLRFWYGESISVKDLYRKIFVSSYHNYAMPATLSGTTVELFIKDNNKTDLAEISDYFAEQYLSNRSRLEGVRIIVHPLCEIYANQVFIHYEYFNSLSLLDDDVDIEKKEPVCSLVECQSMDEAIRCMDRVFLVTSKIIKNADGNFCQKCNSSSSCKHGKISKECKSVTKGMYENDLLIKNTLYASRVITSHINYLDAYRKYIWKIQEMPDNNEIKAKLRPNILKDIILKYIDKYVRMCNMNNIADESVDFQRIVYDNNIAQSIHEIEYNMMFQDRNRDRWIPIKGHKEKSDILEEIEIENNVEVSLLSASVMSAKFEVNGCSFIMKPVGEGVFEMGDDEVLERIKHIVHLRGYYIGETQVTQQLWTAVMGTNPSLYVNENNPVERVSWEECNEFIVKLNSMLDKNFRLPTEAEWEYAARGGGNVSKYSGSDDIKTVAWYEQNSNNHPHKVKSKKANKLGIYDMSGNVFEWCNDWYDAFSDKECNNPTGPETGEARVIRGGSWYSSEDYCLVTSRWHYDPQDKEDFIGFRLVLDMPIEKQPNKE